jgi:aerobic carbon-monoxide dehydrogenase small subunit
MSGARNMVSRREVNFTVNGKDCSVSVYPMQRLLDVLRSELGLTGTKEGCGEGECGSCSVLLNGELVNSCLIPVLQVQGANVCTIEGLADPRLHPIQQAFLECGGAQCGICTPGMILATVHLLQRYPQPSMEQIREGLNGNLCRCTGYGRIFQAVQEAAKRAVQEPGREEAEEAASRPAELEHELLPRAGLPGKAQ